MLILDVTITLLSKVELFKQLTVELKYCIQLTSNCRNNFLQIHAKETVFISLAGVFFLNHKCCSKYCFSSFSELQLDLKLYSQINSAKLCRSKTLFF